MDGARTVQRDWRKSARAGSLVDMSERVRLDDNLSCEVRLEEYCDIKRLLDEFGEAAYPAVKTYYSACGFEAGYDLLLALLKEGRLSREKIRQNPPESLRFLLQEFFTRRGGNQPILEREGTTVTLKTENTVFCPSPIAQKESGVPHKDVCHIHKRAFVEGLSRVLEAFIPGVQIQYVNVSSRSIEPGADCVEAFHVQTPW
jgi:hypothetical protein